MKVLCSHANLAICDLDCKHLHEHEEFKHCIRPLYCEYPNELVQCTKQYENLKIKE